MGKLERDFMWTVTIISGSYFNCNFKCKKHTAMENCVDKHKTIK